MRARSHSVFLILAASVVVAPCVGGRTMAVTHSQPAGASAASSDELNRLSVEFWAWRAAEQPISGDDIPRIERPADWVPDWSRDAVAGYRRRLAVFEQRWRTLAMRDAPVARQVDYRLLGSAMARVRWELDVAPDWRRNPLFYLNQTLGAVYEGLLPSSTFDEARGQAVIARLRNVPRTVKAARLNLDQTRRPFAELAIAQLTSVGSQMGALVDALRPLMSESQRPGLSAAAESATKSLEEFREWLIARRAALPTQTAIGRAAYVWFLTHVALVPFTPEEMLAMGRQEWRRAVTFETIEKNRNAALPPLRVFPTIDAQIEQQAADEQAVRRFLAEHHLLTVPDSIPHYRYRPRPGYLVALGGQGVTDDLTGPSRLDEDATHYIPAPSPDLPYFYLSMAQDPRGIIVHEGVPGHYFQLARSWRNPDPIRRHYYDSNSNEGLGFYAEEMMLQAGLFDNQPRSREIIYNFMRLRALRVEVDVRLALGDLSIPQAAEYLERTVPMDKKTALEEAAMFAGTPGQAITYQIGKLQIVQMLADARRAQRDRFDLQAFHDALWTNGNVPLTLQRWEMLGLRDDLDIVERRAREADQGVRGRTQSQAAGARSHNPTGR
jgi:Bacterial protein of unknown function (DUF885)